MTERLQRLFEQRLQIHLPRVDDVVDAPGVSERRGARIRLVRRRRPEWLAVPLRRETSIAEVLAEQSELPELVRDVFADVGDDAIRSNDYLLALDDILDDIFEIIITAAFVFFNRHHPAARELALGLQEDGALAFQNLERLRPESQLEDVAFVRQQVVRDIQPGHRLQ